MRFLLSLFIFIPALASAQYTLKCNVRGGCPEAIGLVRIGEGSTLRRCTGFLIAEDLVVTAGHCLDLATGQTAAFISRADLPGGAQTRKLVSTVYRVLTANLTDSAKLSGWPDAAVYKLESAIENVRPLSLAQGAPRSFSTARAYVIDQKVSEGLTIEALDCQVHRHERFFPYDLTSAPDVLRFFGCQAEAGFSGAPFLAAGGNEVEALVNGPQDPPQDKLPFPFVASVEVSNARCLNYAGSPARACFHPNDQDMQTHFQQVEAEALKSLQTWQPFPPQTPLAFTNYIYPGAAALTYQVDFYPNCRRANWDLRSLSLPVEKVQMAFDTWAQPKFQVLTVESAAGKVISRAGVSFQVQMHWTPLSQDLSRQLGATFSVALPPCAR